MPETIPWSTSGGITTRPGAREALPDHRLEDPFHAPHPSQRRSARRQNLHQGNARNLRLALDLDRKRLEREAKPLEPVALASLDTTIRFAVRLTASS
jgi:hypothetical protein